MNLVWFLVWLKKLIVDHFWKKAEKLFESIDGKAAADADSDYICINFLYNDGEFIGSKFLRNSPDPEKTL